MRTVCWFFCSILIGGCVVSVTGDERFSEAFDLDEAQAVRIAVPATPLMVEGCDPTQCRELEVQGRWIAVGVTADQAEELAQQGDWDFDIDDGFARLVAVKPLEVEDLLDLEVEGIELPWDRDLELRTSVGDVSVEDVRAAMNVRVQVGDVDVEGGDDGVFIRSGRGRIRVETGGSADLATDAGSIELYQTGGRARDVYAVSRVGNVLVELGADEDLDLVVFAQGRIEVDTKSIRTITGGQFSRRIGEGSNRVEIHAGHGDVRIVDAATRTGRGL